MPASAARVLRASEAGWRAGKSASERPEDLQKRRHSGEAEGHGSNAQDSQGSSDGGYGRLMTHDLTVERAQQAAVLRCAILSSPLSALVYCGSSHRHHCLPTRSRLANPLYSACAARVNVPKRIQPSSRRPLRLPQARVEQIAQPVIYDNSVHEPRLIASGAGTETLAVDDADLWRRLRVDASDEG